MNDDRVKRVVGPNGSSPVSFHTEWPLSHSEVLFQKGGFAPIFPDAAYKALAERIVYTSSF